MSGELNARFPPIRQIKPELPGIVEDAQRLFIVFFDPGVTTGWCVFRIHIDSLVSGGLKGLLLSNADSDAFSWSAGKFGGPEPYMAEQMMALVRGTWMHGGGRFDAGQDSDLFVVGLESFVLREFSTDDSLLSPPRVSAAFRALGWRAPFPVITQSPSDAMSVFTDARLRAFNLWSGPAGAMGEHQRDATRHAALLARKCYDERALASLESRMPWIS